jgi:hypothetical protein
MSLFTKKKEPAVQSLVLKIVNNNCPELRAMIEGPRNDSRVNLLLVVMVIPLEKNHLAINKVFMAVTKEFSTTGVAVVVDTPRAIDKAVLGFRFEGEMHFVLAEAKHHSPLGGGFFQLGFKMSKIVLCDDYPELRKMSF